MAKGACMAKGGVYGEGGHAWQRGGMRGMHTPLYEIRPVNTRVARILLECILVPHEMSSYQLILLI